MGEKVALAVRLDVETREKLQALGDAKRRTPHWLMCEAIRLYVERESEAERMNREDDERLAEFDRTGEDISDEDVDAWLKSWGTDHELPTPERVQRVKR